MTSLDSILKKKRDISLPTKFLIVKTMVFPVVMYGCEGWTIKKAEQRRIYTFKHGARKDSRVSDSKEIQLVNPKGNQP